MELCGTISLFEGWDITVNILTRLLVTRPSYVEKNAIFSHLDQLSVCSSVGLSNNSVT